MTPSERLLAGSFSSSLSPASREMEHFITERAVEEKGLSESNSRRLVTRWPPPACLLMDETLLLLSIIAVFRR